MFRRQAAGVQEEPISEELIANIPVVGDAEAEATLFVPVDDETFPAGAPAETDAPAQPAPELAEGAPFAVSPLAQQLRYEMGEAFARELDRAEATLNAALADLEARAAAAEAALAQSQAEAQRERELREQAEARLKAFKELALK